jgi:hypothetical protein
LKDKYPKLTFFKICVYFFKNSERLGVIDEILIYINNEKVINMEAHVLDFSPTKSPSYHQQLSQMG